MDFLENKKIILISPERWGVNYVSKHHYAISLAKSNNIVYFINPPGNKFKIEKTAYQNLYIIDYILIKGLNKLPRYLTYLIQTIYWYILLKYLKIKKIDVVWNFDPYSFQSLNIFGDKTIKIYHSVDVHYTHLEKICIENADVFFSTSHLILNKFKNINTPMFFINHGLANHFINKPSIIDPFIKINANKKFKIGYIGNLLIKQIDYDSIYYLIESLPECDFYFLGPYTQSNLGQLNNLSANFIGKIQTYSNVYLLGSALNETVPFFLEKMNCLIMCYFKKNKTVELSNVHKTLEYISSGKPVITNFIYEYRTSPFINIVSDAKEMRKKILDVKNGVLKVNEDYINFVHENSYENQIKKINQILTSIFI
jgi:hypothetical protein